jgi:hypothetical protein
MQGHGTERGVCHVCGPATTEKYFL